MEVNRKGNQISIVFTSEEEAQGLYAYLTGTVHEVPQEIAIKGQWIYTWFFTAIQKLAHNFGQESSVATMTPEMIQGVPKATPENTPSKRTRKR